MNKEDASYKNELYVIMQVLLVVHVIKFIFNRWLYDYEGDLSTDNKFVWVIVFLTYIYVVYAYISDLVANGFSKENRMQIWIPVDFLLTCSIILFYFLERAK